MNDELNRCYELLGVTAGASAQELKTAHRDMAKVWHPDRFAHDPRLQQKAQEKLKEINEAYDQLISGKAGRRARPFSQEAPTPAPQSAPPRRGRWQLILLAALVSGVVFFSAFRALVPPGGRGAHTQAPQTGRAQAAEGEQGPQTAEGETTAGASPRSKRIDQQPAREVRADTAPVVEQETKQVRALPTVTITIDPTTGLLATPQCPVKSRMTYPAGTEPRQYCNAQHQTDSTAQADPERPKQSRLKSLGKRLASPGRWFGGKEKP